jgi:hypothetical protein
MLRTPRELQQGILYALGLSYRGLDEGELRLSLLARLEEDDPSREGVLLLVDEAQSLSIDLMEELRMLTNVVQDGVSRVQLVLAGTPDLEDQLADVRLASLQQRIAVRCYLAQMSRTETRAYIQAHLNAAHLDRDLFAADAIHQVHELTEGLPRLVNQLCDHALLLAKANTQGPIGSALVDEAWSDLQQFPSLPPSGTPGAGPSDAEDVLEFGALDGENDPDARIAEVQQQLASIHIETARSSAPDADGFDAEDPIDFSLPDDDWPEVEVVLREAPASRASEFREEEVVTDPFQRLPVAMQIWSPTQAAAGASASAGPRLFVEEEGSREVPPLRSVPLMVHVQTNLFTPDPVWPDEVHTAAPMPLAGEVGRDRDGAPLVEWERKPRESAPQTVATGTSRERAAGAAPRRARVPAEKKFSSLFTSLQD